MNWTTKNYIRFFSGMMGFAALLGLSLVVNERTDAGVYARWLIAFLPLMPFTLSIAALASQIKQLDEMQKYIQLQALLVSALVTGALAISVGILQANELIPQAPVLWVPLVAVIIWGLASLLIARKYQ